MTECEDEGCPHYGTEHGHMTKDEIAVSAICNAVDKVRELLAGVDEGKIPIRKYLGALVRQLENAAVDLEERCEEWSGS